MFVKICGVARREDAIASAEAGADAIGLNFIPESSRRVSIETARTILDQSPPSLMTVGVFRGHTIEQVVSTVDLLDLDAVQLHEASPELLEAVAAVAPFTILALESGSHASASAVSSRVDAVLLDGPEPGSGTTFDWDTIGDLTARDQVLLAGGLHPGNVADAVRRARPWGVDVATGVESSPGIKDQNAVARFVDAARSVVQS